jgi:AcrR family transcriptional regulator
LLIFFSIDGKIQTAKLAIRNLKMKNSESIRNPKQKRSISTKEKILDTAYKLFCEKGYYQTTTNEIARVAEVSIGSLYSYFKDKDTIFLEILDRYSKEFSEIFKGLSRNFDNSTLSLTEMLRLFIERMIEIHVLTKDLNQEMIILSYSMPKVKVHIDERRNVSRQVALNQLIEYKDQLRVTDLEAAAIVTFNLITTTVDQVAFESNRIEKERIIEATMDMLEKYLLK